MFAEGAQQYAKGALIFARGSLLYARGAWFYAGEGRSLAQLDVKVGKII